MAKNRYVNTHFWKDTYIINLDPIEKLLFAYFLTNPATNIAGVYELSLREIALDTGIDKEMIERIISRFENDGKIYYKKGYIIMKNHVKHQENKSPKIISAINTIIADLPQNIKNDMVSIGYVCSIDTLSHLTKLNLTKSNLTETDGIFEEKFKTFWKLYPRKDGNMENARSLLLEEKITDWGQFFEAVKNYAADVENRDFKYIKYPVSFIPIWKDFL